MAKKRTQPKAEKLTRRTIQIFGFGFAIFLTIVKLVKPELDIPWYVVFGFFGFGASADGEIIRGLSKRK